MEFHFFVLEILGEWLINSVLIISGATHDCGDTAAIAVSWVLERRVSEKRLNEKISIWVHAFLISGRTD